MTRQTLSFTKMQGCGNDFVVIDATRVPFQPSPDLLRRLTDRRYGVGCDQVLVVEPPREAVVDFNYRIFNPDGSEVGQCGNGVRALARFIEAEGLSAKPVLEIQTRTARLRTERLADGQVRVNMGVPRFAAAELPLAMPEAPHYQLDLASFGVVKFDIANIGNPHAVLQVPDVDAADVAGIGAALQAQTAFPESVNVGFLQIIDATHARLRVYERGAGETLACGSGACAAFAVARRQGLLAAEAELQLAGGTLRLAWDGEGTPVMMTGPAETTFKGALIWES